MTEGGPYYATDVIATYVYRTAFSSEVGMPRLGYASAAALFFGGAVIIIGLLLNVIKGRLQNEGTIGGEVIEQRKKNSYCKINY